MAAAAPSVHDVIKADMASPPALKVASVAVDPISVTASAATVSISIARADGSPLLPELPKEDAASAVRTSSMVLSWARAQGLKFVIETAPNTISATMYSFVGTVWTAAKGAFEGSHASTVGADPMAPAHGKVAGGKFRFRLTDLPEESPLCVRVSLESTGGKSGTVEATFATISKAAEPEVLKKAALERERRIAASKAVTHVRSTALKTKSADLARREAEAAAARRAADAQRRQPVATTEAEPEEDEFSMLKDAKALREAMLEALSAAHDDGATPADAVATTEAEPEEDEFSMLKDAKALREAMLEALSAAHDDGATPADAAAAAEAGSAEEAAAPAEEAAAPAEEAAAPAEEAAAPAEEAAAPAEE